MENLPGTPSEDWINPPDENQVGRILKEDSDYLRLKKDLIHHVPKMKCIAKFLRFNSHHRFDEIHFETPLIGNDALTDVLDATKKMHKACKEANYFTLNMSNLVSR
jgi:hypothetical protein